MAREYGSFRLFAAAANVAAEELSQEMGTRLAAVGDDKYGIDRVSRANDRLSERVNAGLVRLLESRVSDALFTALPPDAAEESPFNEAVRSALAARVAWRSAAKFRAACPGRWEEFVQYFRGAILLLGAQALSDGNRAFIRGLEYEKHRLLSGLIRTCSDPHEEAEADPQGVKRWILDAVAVLLRRSHFKAVEVEIAQRTFEQEWPELRPKFEERLRELAKVEKRLRGVKVTARQIRIVLRRLDRFFTGESLGDVASTLGVSNSTLSKVVSNILRDLIEGYDEPPTEQEKQS